MKIERAALVTLLNSYHDIKNYEGFISAQKIINDHPFQDFSEGELLDLWMLLSRDQSLHHTHSAREQEFIKQLLSLSANGVIYGTCLQALAEAALEPSLKSAALAFIGAQDDCFMVAYVFNKLRLANQLNEQTLSALRTLSLEKIEKIPSLLYLIPQYKLPVGVADLLDIEDYNMCGRILSMLRSKELLKPAYGFIFKFKAIFFAQETINLLNHSFPLNETILEKMSIFLEENKNNPNLKNLFLEHCGGIRDALIERIPVPGYSIGALQHTSTDFGFALNCNQFTILRARVENNYHERTNEKRALKINLQDKLRNMNLDDLTSLLPTKYFTNYHHVHLDLSFNALNIDQLERFLSNVNTDFCPENFHIQLSNNQLDTNHVVRICRVLERNTMPLGLKLIFTNCLSQEGNLSLTREAGIALGSLIRVAPENFSLACYLDGEAATMFADSLDFAPKGLRLQFDNLQLDGYDALARKLISNTAVSNVSHAGFTYPTAKKWMCTKREARKELIEFFCLRNRLLHAYPHFSHVILKICQEKGLYKSLPHTVKSAPALKGHLVPLFFKIHPILAKATALPQELIEFIGAAEKIAEELENKKLPHPAIVKKLYSPSH